jgi:hypothetical protein
MRAWIRTVAVFAVSSMAATPAVGQGDFGDAPEGGVAYPSSLVMGRFPTCVMTGPFGWVEHGPVILAFFGGLADLEGDGNANFCPPTGFPPYDQDECLDNDSGLLIPSPFTIMGGNVVPCATSTTPLGPPCGVAMWMTNVDIFLTNANIDTVYVNILIDWEQDGDWTGGAQCPTGAVSEHAVQDFVVPPGFMGPLSLLTPPSIQIGPNAGYVWSRFTVTGDTVGVGWDGSGNFEDGESEDYLLLVGGPVSTEGTSWGRLKSKYR